MRLKEPRSQPSVSFTRAYQYRQILQTAHAGMKFGVVATTFVINPRGSITAGKHTAQTRTALKHERVPATRLGRLTRAAS